MSKISIMETISDAFAYVWNGRGDLLMLAFLPVLVLALLGALEYVLIPAVPPVVETEDGAAVEVSFEPVRVVVAIATLVFYAMFAVAWHRRFLVPGETPTVGAALRWGGRQTRFFTRFIVILLLSSLVTAAGAILIVIPLIEVVGIAGGGLQILAALAVILAALVVYSRLLPVLPAAAVDTPMGLRAAWRLTRGYSPHMVMIWLVPSLALLLPGFATLMFYGGLARGIGLAPSITAAFLGGLIAQAFSYASIAVSVTALSIAYRGLTATPPATST